jgi:transcriptional regulator of arginine metabolism
MAQAVCASIDSMQLSDVVGTIAGDDTIFILMRTEQKAFEFVKMFTEKFI